MAEDPKKPAPAKKKAATSASKKPTDETKNDKVSSNPADDEARIEAEKKALEDIITKSTPGVDKKKALDEIRKQVADDIIRTKPRHADHRTAEEIKKAAAEAKKAKVKILDQTFVADPNDHLERLANSFDASARRWELVVYPTLFAFILLAGYGFYLIYRLTHDIAVLSESVTHMAIIVSDSMPKMTRDIRGMTSSVDDMSGEINTMSGQMTTLTPMSQNIANMTGSMTDMNRSVYGMQRDMGGLNRTISGGPFGMMNDVMPFTSNSYTRPPPPLPQSPRVASPYPMPVPEVNRARTTAPAAGKEEPEEAFEMPPSMKQKLAK